MPATSTAPVQNTGMNARDRARLRRLQPLRQLSDSEFSRVADQLDVETLGAGAELLRAGKDDGWSFYLLDGSVRVADQTGDTFSVVAGSVEAVHPLTAHARMRVSAVAETAVRFVRMPAGKTAPSTASAAQAGIEVTEISGEADAVDELVLFELYHALQEDTLVLPSLPDVAVRVLAAVEDERMGAAEIARLIQADPALAAYCMNIANSAAYGGYAHVADIREAVMRMGLSATRTFVLAQAARGLFHSDHPLCARWMRLAWRHAADIGALCHVIAHRISRQNPDQAMLAGLLHDLGVMVILAELSKQPALLEDESAVRAVLLELKHQITVMVLRKWKLPDVFVEAVFAAENWARDTKGDFDLSDTLLLAHWHQPERNLPWADPRPAHPALLHRFPAEAITETGRLQLVDAAGEEVRALITLLGGDPTGV